MKLLLLTTTLILLGINAQFAQNNKPFGAPTSNLPRTVQQSDGNSITIVARGDQAYHWFETSDGYTIIEKDGNYHYAIKQNNTLIPSEIKASDLSNRSVKERAFLNGINKSMRPELANSRKNVKLAANGTVPSTGKINIPVILIDYNDKAYKRNKEDVKDMFMKEVYNGNFSFRDYFLSASHNQLDLNIDVFGWYSSPDNMSKYADKAGMYKTGELIQQAAEFAENDGADFSKYDNNNDGKVDLVIVMHAGEGAEQYGDDDFIWAHSWSISGTGFSAPTYDGVKIDAYNVGCETRGYGDSYAQIGLYCHEFGHAMGLPDLYDGSWKSNGLGHWCMMSAGSWLGSESRPGNFSAWCRLQLGWDEAQVLDSESTDHISLQATNSNKNEILRVNTYDDNEYFLLTNRQKDGVDIAQPGTGLAIYHINHSKAESGSSVNNNRDNPGVRLMEADFNPLYGLYNAKDRGKASDLFPGTTNNTVFNPESTPNSNLFNGSVSGIVLSEIKNQGGIVSFYLAELKYLVANTNTFYESTDNNGSIASIISLDLLNTNFSQSNGLLPSSAFTIENLPTGLSLEIKAINAQKAEISLKGNATSHNQDVNNITLFFQNSAFEDTDAQDIVGSAITNLSIDFIDEGNDNYIYYEGFETYVNGTLPTGWTEENEENSKSFKVEGTVQVHDEDNGDWNSSAYLGSKSLFCVENWGSSSPVELFAISPFIDLGNHANAILSYWELMAWDNYWPEAKPEHNHELLVRVQNSNTWEKISDISTSENDFQNWQKQEISLSAFEGDIIQLGFKTTTHHYYWRLDEIIVEGETSSVKSTNVKNIFAEIYPNPSKGFLQINLKENYSNAQMKIYDYSGKLIQSHPIKAINAIDLSTLKNGVYIIEISTTNLIQRQKIILNK